MSPFRDTPEPSFRKARKQEAAFLSKEVPSVAKRSLQSPPLQGGVGEVFEYHYRFLSLWRQVKFMLYL